MQGRAYFALKIRIHYLFIDDYKTKYKILTILGFIVLITTLTIINASILYTFPFSLNALTYNV